MPWVYTFARLFAMMWSLSDNLFVDHEPSCRQASNRHWSRRGYYSLFTFVPVSLPVGPSFACTTTHSSDVKTPKSKSCYPASPLQLPSDREFVMCRATLQSRSGRSCPVHCFRICQLVRLCAIFHREYVAGDKEPCLIWTVALTGCSFSWCAMYTPAKVIMFMMLL